MPRCTLVVLTTLLAALAAPAVAPAAGRCGEVAQRPWCDTAKTPEDRAGELLTQLTLDEKLLLLAGDDLDGVAGGANQHTGTNRGVDRVGLPSVFYSDGPVGPRQGMATAMPSPIGLASAFDERLASRHAAIIGDEARRKGNDVVYAPAVNMLRTPLNGRTFEYFGEDPYLSARTAVGWTKGLQGQGVIGNVKHFAVNNQEGIGANPPGAPIGGATAGSRITTDARVDERTLREIYLPAFEAAVKEGGVGSVMCAYNRVNGQFACENEHLLEDILKEEWGFDGFVLTDYGAAKNTVPSLQNGLDLDIWPAQVYRPELVRAALQSGQITEAAVDEHIRRQLRTLFAFGFFDRAGYPNDETTIDKPGHHAAAAEIEQQSAVLLENDGDLLPLDAAKVGRLALIGPEAEALKNGGGSSNIKPYLTTTPRQAIETRLGAAKVVVDDGSDPARAAAVAKAADTAVVVIGDTMSEGSDKPCLGINCAAIDGVDRDALVRAVAAAQKRTVLVLQTGGPILTPWRDEVPAILEAWYPGQNGGTAIARILFGDVEPGGRLSATFPLREADEPTAGDPRRYPGVAERTEYSEGVLIGYRWFDEQRLGVAYPFGHGLGYTRFAFSDLRLEPGTSATVSAVVQNTGKRAGTAVPQLYVGLPEAPGRVQPPRQLKGFTRVALKPGERKRVRFTLDERAFSYYDTAAAGWRVAPGCYGIAVGASSRDLPLSGTIGRGRDCGGALELPVSLKACSSRRLFTIRLPRSARRATVTVGRRKVRTVRRGGRLTARIDLRRRPAGRVVVKVVGRTKAGRVVRQTRVYRTCAKGRR